jgi:hypothetical protein
MLLIPDERFHLLFLFLEDKRTAFRRVIVELPVEDSAIQSVKVSGFPAGLH